ncbi:leucine-rich repeat and fibronectin type III domain-containing protein 1-like protein [Rhipicephalus microplus]
MPKLIAMDLGDNLIKTFDEESIAPIFKQPLYDLIISGNPLHCDCKLRFLRGHIKNWRLNHCATPESLRGHHLNWVTDQELGCRNATPPAVPRPPKRR